MAKSLNGSSAYNGNSSANGSSAYNGNSVGGAAGTRRKTIQRKHVGL